ncbi:MAG TPA: flagellar biosynthetic protein FliR [Pirellulaceae bacterium]|jgi:flagellar biosynthetic protein FliR
MSPLLALYLDQFIIFVLVLTRIGALLMTMPVLGTATVPLQVRALLAVGISLVLTPLFWGQPIPAPENLMILGTLLAREAMLGLALGLALMILLSGMQLAGQIISQTSGMTLADVANPTFDTTVPLFSQILEMLATAIFFVVGGHRQVMDALMRSFTWMPPGNGRLPDNLIEALTVVTSQSFEVAIRASAPVLVALLVATLIVALISRTLPQLNAVAVGLNFNSIIVMGMLALCLGSAAWVFQDHVEGVIDAVTNSFSSAF